MNKKTTIQERFRAAAKYFEEVYKKNIGRGFQARVSEKSEIRASYFNEILKGKKDGPEEVRRKLVEGIANVCDEAKYFTYEMFLELGDCILESGSPKGYQLMSMFSGELFPGDIRENLQSLVNEASGLRNNPKVQFNFALFFLLNEIDVDAKKRLSSKYDFDFEILNIVAQGNACLILSDKQKWQIASDFHLSYEYMLSLGAWIFLSGKSGKKWLYRKKQPHLKKEYTHEKPYPYEHKDPSSSKKDKNMLLIAEWINQQDEPDEYWTLLKIILKREEPEFKDWLKKQSSGDNQNRLPENKSAVGE